MPPTLSHILASSSDFWIEKQTGNKVQLPHLKEGQIIEARVDRVISSRQVQLNIQGKAVFARTYVPLKTGETLLLRVTQSGTQQVFKLIEAKTGNRIHLPLGALEALGRPGPYGILSKLFEIMGIRTETDIISPQMKEIERIEKLVRALSIQSYRSEHGFLKSLIKGSGLAWENKLLSTLKADPLFQPNQVKNLIDGDLKALAMRLMLQPTKESKAVMQHIQSFTDGIEILQRLNSQASEQFGRYILPLPFLSNDAVKFGQMLIDLGKGTGSRKNPKDRMVNVSFLLEMSNLGGIQADFSILKKDLSGSFRVENEEIRSFIEKNVPGLIKKLQKNGFNVHNITCLLANPQTLSTTSFIDRLIDSDDGMLNIVI